jgi:hypothetical protein
MTEHSVEELERQYQSAKDKWHAAELSMREADARLQKARNDASGIIGHILEYTVRQGYGKTEKTITRRLLVDKVKKMSSGTEYAYGRLVKADGHKSIRSDHVDLQKTADKGIYEEPK